MKFSKRNRHDNQQSSADANRALLYLILSNVCTALVCCCLVSSGLIESHYNEQVDNDALKILLRGGGVDASGVDASGSDDSEHVRKDTGATATTDADGSATSAGSSSTLDKYVRPKYQKHDWEGVPAEEPGHPLVAKGRVDFIDNAGELFLEKYLEEFLTVYENRPDKVNLCGMRINHSYSLFLAVKALQPTSIIENGVNAGHSTYIMRAAAPNAKIYAVDPLEKPICGQEKRWIDTVNAEYITGDNFKDFTEIDWAGKIKSGEVDPKTTLVLLDDHLDPSTRYPFLLKFGFRHILLEDNYKYRKGATAGDKAGWLPKQLFHQDTKDSQFFYQITKRYAEFPPLVPPILARQSSEPSKPAGGFLHASDDVKTLVAPLLRPDLSSADKEKYEYICKRLGIDPNLVDKDSYMQIMNYNQFCYIEMTPLADRLLEMWPK